MTERITHVLIHPADRPGLEGYQATWQGLAVLPTTYVIPEGDHVRLHDSSYLYAVNPDGRYLVDGPLTLLGTTGEVCVPTHLSTLVGHPRVMDGEVQLVVDATNTFLPMSLPEIAKNIFGRFGVFVRVV